MLGLRQGLAKGRHALVLTSYTDARVCCLPPNQPSGGPRFDRDAPKANGGGIEKRVDPSDGCSYSHQEFVDFCVWHARKRVPWNTANPALPLVACHHLCTSSPSSPPPTRHPLSAPLL